jgi:2,4'-dihydroxyacetophenone dioxygenase
MEKVTMTEAPIDTAMAGQGSLHPCDPRQLPWVEWGVEGAYFKLLSVDALSGRFSLLIKLDKGCVAPTHRHVGAVEGMVLEGSFHYVDEPHMQFAAGTYLLEKDGAVHRPASPEGALMFAVFHGPVEVLDREGNIAGRIDWRWHMDVWKEAMSAAGA